MKIQNKTKSLTTIIVALAVGFVLLSPTTIMPSVNAQTQSRNLPADWQLEQKILPQLLSHRGQWVGMTSCDHNVCKVDYLGPTSSNPYGHGLPTAAHSFKINGGTDPYQAASAQIQPVSYYDGANNQYPAQLEQDFTAESSNNGNVDLMQNLNAWSGGNTHWVQSVLFYDKADLTGTGVNWYMEMDSHDTSGNDDFGSFIPVKSITTQTSTDSFKSYVWAMGDPNSSYDGCYEAEVDDVTSAHLQTAEICESNDTANTLYLTHQVIGSGSTSMDADAGSMTEELDTDDSSVYYWSDVQSNISYTLGFYDHVGGTEYTTMNQGWTSNAGSGGDLSAIKCTGGLSISTSNNVDTQDYTHLSTCP